MRYPAGAGILVDRWMPLAIGVLVVTVMQCGMAHAAATAECSAFVEQRTKGMKGQLEKIKASRSQDPRMKRFYRSLSSIDHLAVTLLEHLNTSRPSGKASSAVSLGSIDIYERFAGECSKVCEMPGVSASERDFLGKYYTAYLQAASEYVMREVASRKPNAHHVEFAMVLPLLATSANAWSRSSVEALPNSLKTPDATRVFEELAWMVARPDAALCFAKYSGRAKAGQEFGYISGKVKMLEQRGEHKAMMACCLFAAELAKTRGAADSAIGMMIYLAKAYGAVGHPFEAAEVIKTALADYPTSCQKGILALLRLKYLYKAGKIEKVLEESLRYIDDPSCRTHAAPLMYTAWVANRRARRQPALGRIQTRFLKEYPKHPLAANILFAMSMNARAVGDYEKADAILKKIESGFPKSRVLKRVKDMRKKIGGLVSKGKNRSATAQSSEAKLRAACKTNRCGPVAE